MSDQGEFSARWNALDDDSTDQQPNDAATGPIPQVNEAAEPGSATTYTAPSDHAEAGNGRAGLPEVELPAPAGRTEFSTSASFAPDEAAEPVWNSPATEYEPVPDPEPASEYEPERRSGAEYGQEPEAGAGYESVTEPARRPASEYEAERRSASEYRQAAESERRSASGYEPVAEYDPVIAYEPAQDEPADVPVAGAGRQQEAGSGAARPGTGAEGGGGWDNSIFDGDDEGDPRYAPVMPSGPSTPPKPGTPSSGNWQMPDWMAAEGAPSDSLDDGGRSRRGLYLGVGLLVVALLAAAGVYFFVAGDDSTAAVVPESKPSEAAARPSVPLPPQKPLQRFAGRPSRVLGQVPDRHSGLAYPRLAAPWQLPTKQNKLGQTGWSGQQIVVTEKRAGQMWYGQLLTGTMSAAELSSTAYRGPQDLEATAVLVARGVEARDYGFPHRTRPLASQAISVGGRQGWLVGSYLTYKRTGVRATGEVVAVAVIDTGRRIPAVVFMAVPNTHKQLWPDINQFVAGLKPLR